MRNSLIVCCLAVAIAATGCQRPVNVKPKPFAGAPQPAAQGTFAVGSVWRNLRNGAPIETVLAAKEGQFHTYQSSWGCTWVREENAFAPSLRFANCGGSDGAQKITGEEGKIWPLRVGSAQSWSIVGQNANGDTWETTRRCKVESTERVTVPAGAFDTYKVVCLDNWRTRTWYYAPAIKATVLFTNYDSQRQSIDKFELVSAPVSQ